MARDKHDDGGVGPRKVLRTASRPDADADMSAFTALRCAAADAAEAMAPMPVDDALRVGEDRSMIRRHDRADTTQRQQDCVTDHLRDRIALLAREIGSK